MGRRVQITFRDRTTQEHVAVKVKVRLAVLTIYVRRRHGRQAINYPLSIIKSWRVG